MLSDDITGTIGKGVSAVGAVIGGAIRGAILGAALVVGAAALTAGAFFAVHAFATMGILGAISMGISGAFSGGAAMLGFGSLAGTAIGGTGLAMGTALTSAAAGIGAVVLGATSIIPGASEWFGFKGLLTRRERSSNDVPYTATEPQRTVVRNVTLGDNYLYQPGYGAQSKARGDNVQGTGQYRG